MLIDRLIAAVGYRRLLALVICLAFILRVQGMDWDAWYGFHPDEDNLVRAALTLSFPNAMISDFHAYNGLSVALPRLLAWASPGIEVTHAGILWAARLISALSSTAAVVVGALLGRAIVGTAAGLTAAVLLATSAPLIQFSHFGTTESALILTVLLLWYSSVMFLRDPTAVWKYAIAWGIILGIGLGMKTAAAPMAVIPLTAVLLRLRQIGLAGGPAAALCALVCVTLLLASTPALIFRASDYFATMAFERDVVSGAVDVFWTWQFAGARNGVFEIQQLWGLMGGPLLLISAFGVVQLLRRDRAPVLLALVFLVIYCAITFCWHAKFVRYLAPILPILIVLAAPAVAGALNGRFGHFSLSVAAAAVALFVAKGLSQAAGYQSPDPRLVAAEWLRGHVAHGEVVLIEPRDVGASGLYPLTTRELPVTNQSDARTDAISEALATADWLVLFSRRHWAVLPRLPDRFPGMCDVYLGLLRGEFGYEVVRSFRRGAPLYNLFRPGLSAEETRVVFDSPSVVVLKKRRQLGADEIARRANVRNERCSVPLIARELERRR